MIDTHRPPSSAAMAWREVIVVRVRSLHTLSLNVPRHFSEIRFDGTDTEVSDLIESSLVSLAWPGRWGRPRSSLGGRTERAGTPVAQDKGYRKKAEEVPQRLLTTRREALSL